MSEEERATWGYTHAVELVRELKAFGEEFCVGGACYPEVHPESENQREDIRYLREKVEAGCDFLTTQMFFDNNLFYNFLYKIREAGITVPVVPGIMPITNGNQVARAITLSGSLMPQRFKQKKYIWFCSQNDSTFDWKVRDFSLPQEQNCLLIKFAWLSGHLALASRILREKKKKKKN